MFYLFKNSKREPYPSLYFFVKNRGGEILEKKDWKWNPTFKFFFIFTLSFHFSFRYPSFQWSTTNGLTHFSLFLSIDRPIHLSICLYISLYPWSNPINLGWPQHHLQLVSYCSMIGKWCIISSLSLFRVFLYFIFRSSYTYNYIYFSHRKNTISLFDMV